MKLHEISPCIGVDQSSYFKGDEDNPRSPYYQEKTKEFDDELTVDLPVYNEDGDELGKATVHCNVNAEFDLRRPKSGWDIKKIDVIHMELHGKKYTEAEAKKQFGEDVFVDLETEVQKDMNTKDVE